MSTTLYQKKSHTFHSDAAFAQWEAKKAAHNIAIDARTLVNEDSAKKFVDDLLSGDQSRIDSAIKQICLGITTVSDTISGRKNAIVNRQKTITQGVMPLMGQVVETYINYGDENDIDMQWMQLFAVDPLQGGLKGSLYDIKSNVVAYVLKSDTADIPESDFMNAVWASILPEYIGDRMKISREILQKDPMTTINNVIIALRYALEELKSSLGYTATQAAITAANGAGYITAAGANIIETINSTRLALFQRNFDKGFKLSGTTPSIIVANEALRGEIEAAFSLTKNTMTNTQAGTVIVQYPITRIYTYNLAATLGVSGEKFAMVLPNRKNRFGIFKNQLMETYTKIENNAVVLDGREAYNFITDFSQFQLGTIS